MAADLETISALQQRHGCLSVLGWKGKSLARGAVHFRALTLLGRPALGGGRQGQLPSLSPPFPSLPFLLIP